jgi:hypothetical protein
MGSESDAQKAKAALTGLSGKDQLTLLVSPLPADLHSSVATPTLTNVAVSSSSNAGMKGVDDGSSSSSGKGGSGAIMGAGAGIGALLLVILIVILYRRRQRQQQDIAAGRLKLPPIT